MQFIVSTAKLRETDPSLDPSDFRHNFPNPIQLGSIGYEVCLSKLSTWFSAVNLVSRTLKWSSDGGSTYTTISIPTGNYTVEDVNLLLAKSQYDGAVTDSDPTGILYGIILQPNYNTNRAEFLIDNTILSGVHTFQVDLSDGGDPTNIRTFLGFPSAVVTATVSGTTTAEVTAGADEWQVRCDLHANSYADGVTSDVIYQFIPAVPPSASIREEPVHRTWFQVNKSTIYSVRIKLTDQSGRKIDLNGEDSVFTFLIRKIGSVTD